MKFKIPRMVLDYGFLFVVPPLIVYKLLPDEKEKTAELLENRPDVQRTKKQQADIVRLILDSSKDEKKQEVISDLLKKGSS